MLSKYLLPELTTSAGRITNNAVMPLLKPFDTRYLKRYGPFDETAELVDLTASAFQVIDNILDGNTERRIVVSGLERRIPALWTEIGIWPAVFQMFQAIMYVAGQVPDPHAFAEMGRRVMEKLD